MTDVNVAVELLGDAQDDTFDTAIIVSGDSDLSGPVRAVRQKYPGKRVVIAFPPRRHSVALRNVGDWSVHYRTRRVQGQPIPRASRKTGWIYADAASELAVKSAQ